VKRFPDEKMAKNTDIELKMAKICSHIYKTCAFVRTNAQGGPKGKWKFSKKLSPYFTGTYENRIVKNGQKRAQTRKFAQW
jgi:hypothetical protein